MLFWCGVQVTPTMSRQPYQPERGGGVKQLSHTGDSMAVCSVIAADSINMHEFRTCALLIIDIIVVELNFSIRYIGDNLNCCAEFDDDDVDDDVNHH